MSRRTCALRELTVGLLWSSACHLHDRQIASPRPLIACATMSRRTKLIACCHISALIRSCSDATPHLCICLHPTTASSGRLGSSCIRCILALLLVSLSRARIRCIRLPTSRTQCAVFRPTTEPTEPPALTRGSFCEARSAWSCFPSSASADVGDLVSRGAKEVEDEVVDE
jgi:hypothetical protein